MRVIAQITDLHIKKPGVLAYGHVDTALALRRLVACLEAFQPRIDLVVVTGDLVDGGAPQEYAHLRQLLAPLQLPLIVCPGNHDDRDALRSAFHDQAFSTTHACNSLAEIEGLVILMLDTSTPGAPHGTLDSETVDWLATTLAQCRGRPVALFMHHPPFMTGIGHMDQQCLRSADVLERLVREHGNVRLVAAGHVHRAVFTGFAGTTASIAPAPNHAVALDLAGALPPVFMIEPPGFHLHAWLAGRGELVTHQVSIGTFDGPHPFFTADGRLA
jgi:3',5'-cyclic AMP phosphodiesterase CpdA